MSSLDGLNFGLGGLPLLSDTETRSICAENPTGAKGAADQAGRRKRPSKARHHPFRSCS